MPRRSTSMFEPAVVPMTSSFLAWASAAVPDRPRVAATAPSTRWRRMKGMAVKAPANGWKGEEKGVWREGAFSALVQAVRDRIAAELDDLHDDDEQRHGEQHHVGLEAVVAVADGQVSDAAAAHDARDGGVRQETH